ncbi:hypothetical protein [Natronobeatus ordinarius]|uniref:hypothetical protein n=1 Tax=Natronobeatus ordinarius TaxID=2963433 RepID=UPI0020CBC1C6|nr:hypothetical protein [Natronobeatus ordinarius]
MSDLRTLPDRVLTPAGLSLGLLVLGTGYPLWLLRSGAMPSFVELAPFLLAGTVAGLAIDRSLGDGGLAAVVRGERRILATQRDRLARRLENATGLSVGADRDDGEPDEVGWSTLWMPVSMLSSVGTLWFLDVTSPWVVGLVLGVVWSLASVRLVWWFSPVTDGMRRPPRGVDVTEEPHR